MLQQVGILVRHVRGRFEWTLPIDRAGCRIHACKSKHDTEFFQKLLLQHSSDFLPQRNLHHHRMSKYGFTAILLSSCIEISLTFKGAAASDSEVQLTFSTVDSLGVGRLAGEPAIRLLFVVPVQTQATDSERFAHLALLLARGGTATCADSSSWRLSLGFAEECVLDGILTGTSA